MTKSHPSDDVSASTQEPSEFQQLSAAQDPGIVREFFDFLRDNKKWWMAPIVVVLLMLAALVFLAASPAAPFIYTLF